MALRGFILASVAEFAAALGRSSARSGRSSTARADLHRAGVLEPMRAQLGHASRCAYSIYPPAWPGPVRQPIGRSVGVFVLTPGC
jgi:hypothetical protein